MAGASGRRLLSEVRRLPAKSRTRTSDVGNRWSSSSSSPGESGFRSALMGSAVLVASFEWDDSEPLEDSTAVLVHGSFFRDRGLKKTLAKNLLDRWSDLPAVQNATRG